MKCTFFSMPLIGVLAACFYCELPNVQSSSVTHEKEMCNEYVFDYCIDQDIISKANYDERSNNISFGEKGNGFMNSYELNKGGEGHGLNKGGGNGVRYTILATCEKGNGFINVNPIDDGGSNTRGGRSLDTNGGTIGNGRNSIV